MRYLYFYLCNKSSRSRYEQGDRCIVTGTRQQEQEVTSMQVEEGQERGGTLRSTGAGRQEKIVRCKLIGTGQQEQTFRGMQEVEAGQEKGGRCIVAGAEGQGQDDRSRKS